MRDSLYVLIIEDSEDDAVMILRELKHAGYAIESHRVDNPEALHSSLNAQQWDLVICDFAMPRLSGTDALKIVRSTGSDVPFIYVSGNMGEDIAVAAMKEGAQDYLVKTNLKRLVPAVQRELREAEERRQRKLLEQQLLQIDKFEAIGRLAGGIAHDFNNLLGVILGQSEILLESPHDEEIRRGLEMIRESASRGASLTRQLLAFGRRQVLKPKVLNVNVILSDIEKLLRRVIGEDIELDFKMDTRVGSIEADPTQLEQVVLNLATNTRDAMPKGGKLAISTADVWIDETHSGNRAVAKPGRYVQLVVSDTGCGIDKKTQARIFEPFFTTKEKGKGTGLGLATVYGIVKQSGGYIWVYSEPDLGTAFKIYLPTVEAAAESHRPMEQKLERSRGSEAVLVVEDDDSLREVTCAFLEAEGYRVTPASSPEEALHLAEDLTNTIDFLLTDVIMPKMNGRELADKLCKSRPEMKVLYVSGYTDGIVRQDAHGALDEDVEFLEKPYTRQALLGKVRGVLDAPKIKPVAGKR